MADPVPEWEDLAQELPRGWFGYRIPSVNRYLKHLTAQDELKTRAWTQDMQRFAIELGRLEERHKTLGDLIDHMKMECERLTRQVAQEKLNARFADEGVRREIARLEEDHRQRVARLEASATRADLEAQAYETKLWQLTESLTRVLQDAQMVANQQLASDSADSVWTQFCLTVIGDLIAPDTPQVMVQDLLESRRIRPGLVQVSTRAGRRLGYLRSVILSLAPPAIVAYVVPEVGIIPAQDVQILRLRNVTVNTEFHLLNEDDLLSQYTRSLTTAPEEPVTMPQPPSVDVDPTPAPIDVKPDPDPVEEPEILTQLLLEADVTASPEAPSMPTEPPLTADITPPLNPATEAVNPAPLASEPSSAAEFRVTKPTEPSAYAALFRPPAWFVGKEQVEPSTKADLMLPGVSEANPPLSVPMTDPSHSLPFPAAMEELPGLSAKSSLPPPRWSELGPMAKTDPVPEVPLPRVDAQPAPALDTQESGALDVRAFLLGKRVGQDIRDADQRTIARSGEVITAELVQRVEDAGCLPDLIVHMVF